MAVTIHIPGPLQKLTNGQEAVEVEIADVASIEDLINRLETAHPGIKNKLVENGEIRGYVSIFVNDEDIRFIKGKGTEVKEGDGVRIVPSIAGGM